MRDRLLAAGLTGALLLAPALARAQGGQAPPPSFMPPGVYWVHIQSPLPVDLTHHYGAAGTQYGPSTVVELEYVRRVCASPCDTTIDARRGNEFSLEGPEVPGAGPFPLPGPGGPVTLFVEPGSRAGLMAGRYVTVIGSIALLVGAGIFGFYYHGGTPSGPSAAGIGAMVGGSAALGAGIPLLATQHTRIRFQNGALSF